MADYKYCVVVGRFQGFHFGHSELINEALNVADNVIIVIGSAGKARNIRDPWTAQERQDMILMSLSDEQKARIQFASVKDSYYVNNRWLSDVQSAVSKLTNNANDSEICNLGQSLDFPQWTFIKMRVLDRFLKGSSIRGLYFTYDSSYKNHVHEKVAQFMEQFKSTEEFKSLKSEFDYIKQYQGQWEGAPFKPVFFTVDTVVIKSGHCLLIKRGSNPGRGLLALPGGFLNQKETTLTAAIRELKEETSIKLSKEELEKAITESKLFDEPLRSLRGRTITHAFLLDLGSGALPAVKGGDDAAKSFWMPLSELAERESEFFEDHFHIVSYFCGRF